MRLCIQTYADTYLMGGVLEREIEREISTTVGETEKEPGFLI